MHSLREWSARKLNFQAVWTSYGQSGCNLFEDKNWTRRWLDFVASFEVTIIHCSGKDNLGGGGGVLCQEITPWIELLCSSWKKLTEVEEELRKGYWKRRQLLARLRRARTFIAPSPLRPWQAGGVGEGLFLLRSLSWSIIIKIIRK